MLVTFYVHWYLKNTKTLNKSHVCIHRSLIHFQRFHGIPAASTVGRKSMSVFYICSLLHMKF